MRAFELNGIHAELDSDGHLVLSLRAWELDEEDPRRASAFFVMKVDNDGDSVFDDSLTFTNGTVSVSFSDDAPLLRDYLRELSAVDADGDQTPDFEVAVDDSRRLTVKVKDVGVSFSLDSNSSVDEAEVLDNYLLRRIYLQTRGLYDYAQGQDLEPGNNRNALRIADLSEAKREALGESSFYDFYSAVIGEVGVAGKRVKEAREFMEDLIEQLKLMRDSISAVSLDEEMANLMKFQQAFAAAAKILTTADEMLMTLIEAKR